MFVCPSRPAVCGISSLGYDHMEVLGDTLEKIAWQKAGIFKPDCPAFTSPQFPSPMRVLAERAKELKVLLYEHLACIWSIAIMYA